MLDLPLRVLLIAWLLHRWHARESTGLKVIFPQAELKVRQKAAEELIRNFPVAVTWLERQLQGIVRRYLSAVECELKAYQEKNVFLVGFISGESNDENSRIG